MNAVVVPPALKQGGNELHRFRKYAGSHLVIIHPLEGIAKYVLANFYGLPHLCKICLVSLARTLSALHEERETADKDLTLEISEFSQHRQATSEQVHEVRYFFNDTDGNDIFRLPSHYFLGLV